MLLPFGKKDYTTRSLSVRASCLTISSSATGIHSDTLHNMIPIITLCVHVQQGRMCLYVYMCICDQR